MLPTSKIQQTQQDVKLWGDKYGEAGQLHSDQGLSCQFSANLNSVECLQTFVTPDQETGLCNVGVFDVIIDLKKTKQTLKHRKGKKCVVCMTQTSPSWCFPLKVLGSHWLD